MKTLTKCRACGKEVSTRATSCPNCGEPTKAAETRAQRLALIGLMSAVGALVIILLFTIAFSVARQDVRKLEDESLRNAQKHDREMRKWTQAAKTAGD
jgi:hypothetical protein